MSKIKITLIGAGSILLILASVVLYYTFKPDHPAVPGYKLVSEDVFKPYFQTGQSGYVTRGTLYCESLGGIKRYYDHMNARNRGRVFWIVASGECGYESKDRVNVVLMEITGMFAKVKLRDDAGQSPRWMPVIELIQHQIVEE